jgi:hypothetical protein
MQPERSQAVVCANGPNLAPAQHVEPFYACTNHHIKIGGQPRGHLKNLCPTSNACAENIQG